MDELWEGWMNGRRVRGFLRHPLSFFSVLPSHPLLSFPSIHPSLLTSPEHRRLREIGNGESFIHSPSILFFSHPDHHGRWRECVDRTGTVVLFLSSLPSFSFPLLLLCHSILPSSVLPSRQSIIHPFVLPSSSSPFPLPSSAAAVS